MISEPVVQVIPIQTDESGEVRVGGTRVTLDSLVYAFRDGATAEEMVQKYPVLKLGDVYAVISYYLQNQSEIDANIMRDEQEADEFQRTHEQYFLRDFRKKLLARRGDQAN
jgi:uncharacterized protein (DUF433 family)